MACESENVPEYLHWDGHTRYPNEMFLDEHKLYRLCKSDESPLAFPAGQTTALSCKWSLLIREEDILKNHTPELGNSYRYLFVSEVRNYSKKENKEDGNCVGWHKLTCLLNHKPEFCDFSHCEILIDHKVFREEHVEAPESMIMHKIYTYELWNSGNAELNHPKNQFYKRLRNDYRLDIIRMFKHPNNEALEMPN